VAGNLVKVNPPPATTKAGASTTAAKAGTTAAATAWTFKEHSPCTAKFVRITAMNVAIYNGPGYDYKQIGTGQNGTWGYAQAYSFDKNGWGWYKFEANGFVGWVWSGHSTLTNDDGSWAIKEYSPCTAQFVKITANGVGLYSGPGYDFTKTGTGIIGTWGNAKAYAFDKNGWCWYKFEANGWVGWVWSGHSKLTDDLQ